MKRLRHVFLAAFLIAGVSIIAAPELSGQPPGAPAKPKWVPPVKGQAEIGYLPPKTKVLGDQIVTTFKIKNLSFGAIALLRVDEFWWDKANNPIGGDTYRHKKLIMPGEVIEVVLRSQKNPKFFRNNYQFSHANGTVKAKVLTKL